VYGTGTATCTIHQISGWGDSFCFDSSRDELSDLASKAFIPSAVRDEPKIYYSLPGEKKAALNQPNPSVPRTHPKTQCEDRGDLLIRGLWARGTDCTIDVRVTDTDAKSNLSKDPAKVLANHEREKKKKK
jgi:hypothetical protein